VFASTDAAASAAHSGPDYFVFQAMVRLMSDYADAHEEGGGEERGKGVRNLGPRFII
jgi:hypothetical protein